MKQDAASDFPKLATPAVRALHSAGITSLKQLTTVSEEEVMQLHGMGRNALGILREALKAEDHQGWIHGSNNPHQSG